MIQIPGSKSITQRALFLAALSSQKTILINPLFSEDTETFIDALRALGIQISCDKNTLIIQGASWNLKPQNLYLKDNATAYRFLTVLLKHIGSPAQLEGSERLTERIQSTQQTSQYDSARILLGQAPQNPSVSLPYLKLSENIKKNFSPNFHIEPDASSLVPFWVWAKIHHKQRPHPLKNSLQPDTKIQDHLDNWSHKINGQDFPDGVLGLMIYALFQNAETRFTSIGHLRHKESDRLHAMTTNLKNIGAQVQEHEDGLTIHPLKSFPAESHIQCFKDHRIAMTFAILMDHIPNMLFDDRDCVNKSFPNFWTEWKKRSSLLDLEAPAKAH